MKIDICIVKFTPTNSSKIMYSNLLSYLRQMEVDSIEFNILIHDNDIENVGLIKARNILLSKATSEFICFMDFDIEIVNVNWKDIFEKLISDSNIALISPKTSKFSTSIKDKRWQRKEYIACNFMIFKRSVFDKYLEKFDEDFFVAYGDWDIVKRLLDKNLKIVQDNESLIHHFGVSKITPNKSAIWKKDFKVYIEKHKESLNRSLK